MVRKHEIPETKKTETVKEDIPVKRPNEVKADAVVIRGDAAPEKKG